MIVFLKKIIKDKGIQLIIKKTIIDYEKESIPKNLEYKIENLFIEKDGILEPKLTEEDITDITKLLEYFNKIYIEEKKFAALCEERMWNNNEFYEKRNSFSKEKIL